MPIELNKLLSCRLPKGIYNGQRSRCRDRRWQIRGDQYSSRFGESPCSSDSSRQAQLPTFFARCCIKLPRASSLVTRSPLPCAPTSAGSETLSGDVGGQKNFACS